MESSALFGVLKDVKRVFSLLQALFQKMSELLGKFCLVMSDVAIKLSNQNPLIYLIWRLRTEIFLTPPFSQSHVGRRATTTAKLLGACVA